MEGITDAKHCCQSNRPTGLDLLPMAGGEAESEHVLLAVTSFLAHCLEPRTEFLEDALMFRLTGHPLAVKLYVQKHHEQISVVVL